ncbi:MAG: radical SAM protein [Dehalococcoidia bacterium]|nr:radical SAM protein [Dehalococcoidia bacterium]
MIVDSILRRLFAGRSDPFDFRPFRQDEIPTRVPSATGLYIHVPFCRQICPFCPYNKRVYNSAMATACVERMKKEIGMWASRLETSFKPTSLYIGGGTPATVLPQLGEIVASCQDKFGRIDTIAMELHPLDVTPEAVKRITDAGVNQVSVGIQSFHDHLLKRLGRAYDGKRALEAIRILKDASFDALDADIMFAIQGETMEELVEDISRVIEAEVTQLSVYPLVLYSFTPMSQVIQNQGLRRASLLTELRMLLRIYDLTDRAGYSRSALGSFTKPKTPRYTSVTREFYLGLGPGAASYTGSAWFVNTFSIPEYLKYIDEGRFPVALGTQLTEKIRKRGGPSGGSTTGRSLWNGTVNCSSLTSIGISGC